MNKQAVLLAAVGRTAEVAGLKWDLEQTQGELNLTKRELEENKVSDTLFTYHKE